MTIFFTADSHFCHKNIIRYCNRPFEDIVDMNESLILNWNIVVGENDIVYHLGDFSFGNVKENIEILMKLNGKIYLVKGSHDKQIPKPANQRLVVIEPMIINVRVDNKEQPIFLSHYCHKVWKASHYDSWHLFGHSHGGMDDYSSNEGKLLDVGVDSHEFRPWSLDEVVEVMNTRPLNFNSLKRKGLDTQSKDEICKSNRDNPDIFEEKIMKGREEALCVWESCSWTGFEDELDFSDEDYPEGLCPECGSDEWLYTP